MQKFFRLQFFYATEKKRKVSMTIFSIMFSRYFKSVSDRKHRSIQRQTFPRGRFLIGIALCLIICSTTCQENCEKRGNGKKLSVLGNVCEVFEEIRAQLLRDRTYFAESSITAGRFLIVHRSPISGRIWQAKVRKSGSV